MVVKRDRFYKQAAIYYRKLSKQKIPLVTSNYVLVETYTRIRYDDGHASAVIFHTAIVDAIQKGRLNVKWISTSLHEKALEIFLKYEDQRFSFVDCTSFVIAQQVGTKEVFGFDKGFATMGFILRPVISS